MTGAADALMDMEVAVRSAEAMTRAVFMLLEGRKAIHAGDEMQAVVQCASDAFTYAQTAARGWEHAMATAGLVSR